MIIQGKEIAKNILLDLKQTLAGNAKVCFIQFGTDSASSSFIQRKVLVAKQLGVVADVIHKENPASTEHALQIVQTVVADTYDGIVIQLPLPSGLDTKTLLDSIPTHQDIDMLSQASVLKYTEHTTERLPPVTFAVTRIFSHHNIILRDKNIVILGKGELVGRPLAQWFHREHIPIKSFDHTSNIEDCFQALKEADIVITGIGKPHYVKPEMLKKDVVLIDAGTSEQSGKMVGDCDPECAHISSFFSTVPGGVGPITIAGLYNNLNLD